jgi:Tfp pilus assembly protein FimT
MKQTLKSIIRNVKSIKGNSLAEFATTTALMATLAATAAPKLSEMSEGTKAEKSKNEIDKILTQARNHYQDTADNEGRGRFPGQEKFNVPVGGYGTERASQESAITAQDALVTAMGNWSAYDAEEGAKWRSVFGVDEKMPDASKVTNDIVDSSCDTCGDHIGHTEWLDRFGGNALQSQYQDGHFAYAVVPGGGSGTSAFPPVLYVVDIENASNFNNVIEP